MELFLFFTRVATVLLARPFAVEAAGLPDEALRRRLHEVSSGGGPITLFITPTKLMRLPDAPLASAA